MFVFIDLIECKSSTCRGHGDCVELTGPGTLCVCYDGYTLDDCSKSMFISCINKIIQVAAHD